MHSSHFEIVLFIFTFPYSVFVRFWQGTEASVCGNTYSNVPKRIGLLLAVVGVRVSKGDGVCVLMWCVLCCVFVSPGVGHGHGGLRCYPRGAY
jgi:hypothetical protein